MKKHVVMDSIVISNMAVYKTKYIKQKNNKCIKQKNIAHFLLMIKRQLSHPFFLFKHALHTCTRFWYRFHCYCKYAYI